MQMIWSIIKPFKVDKVREALLEIGIKGMTIFDAKGFGRQKGHNEIYRGAEYNVDFLNKVVVMVLVPDDIKNHAIDAITEAAHTGKIGDGIVWAIPFDKYKRIRTGEHIDNDGEHFPDEK